MRVLKGILLTLILMAGLSLSVAAQKGGQEKPPPKENTPRVDPGKKPPPPPRGGDKPKKPGMAMEIGIARREFTA